MRYVSLCVHHAIPLSKPSALQAKARAWVFLDPTPCSSAPHAHLPDLQCPPSSSPTAFSPGLALSRDVPSDLLHQRLLVAVLCCVAAFPSRAFCTILTFQSLLQITSSEKVPDHCT